MNIIRDLLLRIAEVFMSFEQIHFNALNAVNRFIQREFHLNVFHVRSGISIAVSLACINNLLNNESITLIGMVLGFILLPLSFLSSIVEMHLAYELERNAEISSNASLPVRDPDRLFRNICLFFPYVEIMDILTGTGSIHELIFLISLYVFGSADFFDNIDKGERRSLFEDWFAKQGS